MNYIDVAELANRSPSTIKKWRTRIEKRSGYTFRKEKILIGRRRNRKTGQITRQVQSLYKFSDEETQKFVQLSQLIPQKGLDESIRQVFGDREQKLKAEQLKKQEHFYNQVLELEKTMKAVKSKIIWLSQENSRLNERLKGLEEQEYTVFGRPKKKK